MNETSRLRDATLTLPVVGLFLAGYVKGSPVLDWVPFDLTAAFMVALVLAAAYETGRVLRAPRGLGPMVLLTATFLVATAQVSGGVYADQKVKLLLLLTLPAAFAGAVIVNSVDRVWWLARWTLVGGLALGLLLVIAPSTADLSGRLVAEGGDTISIGRGCGAAMVAAVALAVGRKLRWPIALGLVGVLAAIVLGSGSRGPLIGAAVAVFVVLAARPGVRRVRYLVVGATLVVVTGPWLLARTNSAALDRISLLFSGEQDASVQARELMFAGAWEQGNAHPFGLGWGGFARLVPAQAYPHNLALEVFAEAGWIAAAALVLVFAVALGRLLRHVAQRPDVGALLGLLVFWVVNAMFSGDINDNRATIVLLAVALTVPGWLRSPMPTNGDPGTRVGDVDRVAHDPGLR